MTVVFQSYRQGDVPDWIARCMRSVRDWASAAVHDYRFYDDEIFERVPDWYRAKCGDYPQIATDLGRLVLARELLADGAPAVIWLDADVLVFDAAAMVIDLSQGYAFGRERWVEPDRKAGWRTRRNVHNAVAAFATGNPMLEFYIHAATRIMETVTGGVPPQIVGTKFLTALHNMIGLPLCDAVAMASPPVVADLARGGGPALSALRDALVAPAGAVNLCGSLVGAEQDGVELSAETVMAAMHRLIDEPEHLAPG